MMRNFYSKQRGMSLLEIVIGASIIAVGIVSIIATYNVYVKYALNNDRNVEVMYLLEEGVEVMGLLRDHSWTANIVPISTSATTSLYFNGTSWKMSSTTNEYVDGTFTRNIRVYPVYRDANGVIATTGTLDADSRLVTVTVAYNQSSGTTTQTLSKYLVNMHSN
jgi:Tfp pilus assembly protein PilV